MTNTNGNFAHNLDAYPLVADLVKAGNWEKVLTLLFAAKEAAEKEAASE